MADWLNQRQLSEPWLSVIYLFHNWYHFNVYTGTGESSNQRSEGSAFTYTREFFFFFSKGKKIFVPKVIQQTIFLYGW